MYLLPASCIDSWPVVVVCRMCVNPGILNGTYFSELVATFILDMAGCSHFLSPGHALTALQGWQEPLQLHVRTNAFTLSSLTRSQAFTGKEGSPLPIANPFALTDS